MATISENLQTLIDIKSDIKTAIINKGVDVADSDGFDTYATKIESITTGSTGGDGIDFSVIGYSSTDEENANNIIEEDIAYSKTLYDAWDSSNTSASKLYYEDSKLVYAPAINTSNVTDMSNMFYECTSLQSVPQINTSKVNDMQYMFHNCLSLTSIPELVTSNVISMSSMFNGCESLKKIPQLNTSNVDIMNSMFRNCYSLTTIPQLNTSKVTFMNSLFYDCSSLTSIPELDCSSVISTTSPIGYHTLSNLTDLGGFKNLKVSWTSNFLDLVPNATHQSLLNVINGLYDLTANGLSGQTVKFGSTNLAKLTADEIAIATNKGWTITQ